MKPMIFTLVGRDKPGLIDSLAQTVFDLGGNWLGSNFSQMAGHLAGFVEIDLPYEKHELLIETFSRHPDLKIQLVSGLDEEDHSFDTAIIEVVGNDKTGIVQELTAALNQFNINIIKLVTSCESAPNWGGSLFRANATVQIDKDFDLDPLREALEEIANDLVVDIDLQ
jgi:glycine cleavage system regulatory protein